MLTGQQLVRGRGYLSSTAFFFYNINMSTVSILLIFAVVINVVFAGLTYIHSKKEINVLFYTLISVFAGVWAIAVFFMQAQFSLPIFSAATGLHYIAGNLAYLSFFWFAVYYPFPSFKNALYPALITLVNAGILLMIPLSNLFFKNLHLGPLSTESIVFHPVGYLVFVSYLTGVFILGQILLWLKLFKVTAEKQRQVSYVMLAMLVAGTLGIILNLILPWFGNFDFFVVSPILVTIALTSFGLYNILYNRFFDIKIITTELLIIAVWIATLYSTLSADTAGERFIQGTTFAVTLLIGYFLVKSVINEIKQREELKQAYVKLKELDEAKSEFISIASHQLRTPLTAIKGYISMLVEGTYGKLLPKQKKPMENVYQSNERLITLVNDLLNISRIESGRIKMEPQKAKLQEVVQGVLDELKLKAKQKKLKLVLQKSKLPLPSFNMDPAKVRNIILNIIDNAIRYTNKGSIVLELTPQPEDRILQTKSVLITIKDTGEGMSKEELEHLFESFSRGKTGTKLWTEGAGLGLYIAKQFVQMHKGKIWANSPGKGKGSTFFIELPV